MDHGPVGLYCDGGRYLADHIEGARLVEILGSDLSIRYSQRLADNGVVASVGSKGDSSDKAMIESFNGLYKWALIHPHRPWRGIEGVEFSTLEYVDWFNHRRRRGEILGGRRQFTTPAAHEAASRQNVTAGQAVTQSTR